MVAQNPEGGHTLEPCLPAHHAQAAPTTRPGGGGAENLVSLQEPLRRENLLAATAILRLGTGTLEHMFLVPGKILVLMSECGRVPGG